MPATPCELGPPDDAPLLLIAVASGRIKLPGAVTLVLAAGDSLWLAAGTPWVVENQEESARQFLTFEFKSVS